MSTFTGKVLADGQLPTSKVALFTAATTTYLRSLSLFNTNPASQTIKIYFNVNGTSRQVKQYTLLQFESAELDHPVILEAGDTIEGFTTTGAAVDYVITGVTEG